MDQLFVAPTFMAAASMAAALDAGLYPDLGRSVLMVTNNAKIPEIAPSLAEQPGFDTIAARFDDVVHLNEIIFPYHPRAWNPPRKKYGSWRESFDEALGLEEGFGITLQSLPVRPSSTLTKLFPDSPVDVVSDGLMSYGPTRKGIRPSVAERLNRLLYLDLAAGLRPVLLSEHEISTVVLSADAFRAVVQEYGKAALQDGAPESMFSGHVDSIMLGQYLAALDLLTERQEEELHLDFLRAAAQLGHEKVAFKPHPSAPPTFTHRLLELAEDLDVSLTVLDTPVPVEVLYERLRPKAAIGCFSTGLSTAVETYGMEGYTVGVDLLLAELPKFEDSNRIPLVITDVRLNRVDLHDGRISVRPPCDTDVQALVEEVARAMQPTRFPDSGPGRREELLEAAPWAEKYFVVPVPGGGTGEEDDGEPAPTLAQRSLMERAQRRLKREAWRAARRSRKVREALDVRRALAFRPE
ncbi:alpha-2,8-polysialyltransferase family protein [Myceligenerans halotolerans]